MVASLLGPQPNLIIDAGGKDFVHWQTSGSLGQSGKDPGTEVVSGEN